MTSHPNIQGAPCSIQKNAKKQCFLPKSEQFLPERVGALRVPGEGVVSLRDLSASPCNNSTGI